MATMRTMSLMILTLSSGLIPWAGAQQMDSDPSTYSPPPLQEPPPLPSSPRQPPSPGGEIQLYTQPGSGEPAPLASPPAPYSGPVSMPSGMEPTMNSGSGWLPPGGLIQVQDHRGIRYASGGVGESERAELNVLSQQFNLRLLFAMQGSGDYLSDVQVNIIDARGETILSAKSNGPWFFAQLPPGVYTVDVDAMGRTQGQTVRISNARQSHLNFYWR